MKDTANFLRAAAQVVRASGCRRFVSCRTRRRTVIGRDACPQRVLQLSDVHWAGERADMWRVVQRT